MTEGQEHEEYDAIAAAAPVRVHGRMSIDGVVATRGQAAEFGSAEALSLSSGSTNMQVLPRDPNRARAVITCASASGLIYIGSKAQAQATTPLGYQLKDGQSLEVRSQQEVWAAWDGSHAATVSVWVEQWQRNA